VNAMYAHRFPGVWL